jgi:hypothetical protein
MTSCNTAVNAIDRSSIVRWIEDFQTKRRLFEFIELATNGRDVARHLNTLWIPRQRREVHEISSNRPQTYPYRLIEAEDIHVAVLPCVIRRKTHYSDENHDRNVFSGVRRSESCNTR